MHRCSLCPIQFRSQYSLDVHVNVNHQHTRYRCSVCNILHASLIAIKNHLLTHTSTAEKPFFERVNIDNNVKTVAETETRPDDSSDQNSNAAIDDIQESNTQNSNNVTDSKPSEDEQEVRRVSCRYKRMPKKFEDEMEVRSKKPRVVPRRKRNVKKKGSRVDEDCKSQDDQNDGPE